MNQETARRIIRIYNWTRYILLAALIVLAYIVIANGFRGLNHLACNIAVFIAAIWGLSSDCSYFLLINM